MEDDLKKKEKKTTPPKMENEPINQNYLIGCDTIENLPSYVYKQRYTQYQTPLYKPHSPLPSPPHTP